MQEETTHQENLEKELEGAEKALAYFLNGLSWAKANVEMWESNLQLAERVVNDLKASILKLEINDLEEPTSSD